MKATPLAVFAFRRPKHLQTALAALARCDGLDRCRVTIHCDGPRHEDDVLPVEETRRVARIWAAAHGGQLVEPTLNRGLAASISGTVTELCAQHGRVIVLEDDLTVRPDFLRFMLAALERFEDEERVMQIAGCTLAPAGEDSFFLPLSSTWGWATWQRAWLSFDPRPEIGALGNPAQRSAFDFGGAYPFSKMLEDRLAGRNQSWGVLWWWQIFRARGLVLYPPRSLVEVGGRDGSGTHGRGAAVVEGVQSPARGLPAELRFPTDLRVDADAVARARVALRSLAAPARRSGPLAFLRRLRFRLAARLSHPC